MPNINEWLAAGRPKRVNTEGKGRWLYHGCQCNPVLEQQNKPADVAAWLQVCPGCRGGYEAAKGLPYVPGQGFALPGALNVPATAKPISPIQPPVLPPSQENGMVAPAPGYEHLAKPDPGLMGPTELLQPVRKPVEDADPRGSLRTPIPGQGVPVRSGFGGLGVGDYVPWGPGPPPGFTPTTFAPTIGPGIPGIPGPGTDQTGYVDDLVNAAIDVGKEYARRKLGLTGPGTGGREQGFTGASACPDGYHWENGQCVVSGIGGVVQRTLPGGQTGVMVAGEATMGRFGVAMTPVAYAQQTLRCLPGMVLGKDNLCYNKRDLYKRDRKWNPGRKPLLTGGELNVLRKAKSLQEKTRKAAVASGYICRKRK